MLPNLSQLTKPIGFKQFGQDFILLYPSQLVEGKVEDAMQFFVDTYGWGNGMEWIASYGHGGQTVGTIIHNPNSNGSIGDLATIRIYRRVSDGEKDSRTYEITLGSVKSVCDAFLKHASVLGEFADKLFNTDISPWKKEDYPGTDQFDILKALNLQAERKAVERGPLTADQQTALYTLQGFSYDCLRDATEMLIKGTPPEDPNYDCHFKPFDRWVNLVNATKEMMQLAPFDFYVISVAEDLISNEQVGSPFELQRFLATTINFKMLDKLQKFANSDQIHTLLAIKVKRGTRFLPMFYLRRDSTQEYEITLDSGIIATALKVEEAYDCSHYGGPVGCRVVWLEVSPVSA